MGDANGSEKLHFILRGSAFSPEQFFKLYHGGKILTRKYGYNLKDY